MDIRDGTTSLKPDDVSILYFERGELDVSHSFTPNRRGGERPGERLKVTVRFFMEEVQEISVETIAIAGEELSNVRNRRYKRRPTRCSMALVHVRQGRSFWTGSNKGEVAGWWLEANCSWSSITVQITLKNGVKKPNLSGKLRIENKRKVNDRARTTVR